MATTTIPKGLGAQGIGLHTPSGGQPDLYDVVKGLQKDLVTLHTKMAEIIAVPSFVVLNAITLPALGTGLESGE